MRDLLLICDGIAGGGVLPCIKIRRRAHDVLAREPVTVSGLRGSAAGLACSVDQASLRWVCHLRLGCVHIGRGGVMGKSRTTALNCGQSGGSRGALCLHPNMTLRTATVFLINSTSTSSLIRLRHRQGVF